MQFQRFSARASPTHRHHCMSQKYKKEGGEGKRMRIFVYEQNPCMTRLGYCLDIVKNEQNPSFAFSGYGRIRQCTKRSIKNKE